MLQEPKVISVNMRWRRYRRSYQLEATVLGIDSRNMLRLCGYVGRRNRSFVLLYMNTPIRKYTVHARHRDPVTKQIITQPHKHRWDDVWEDKRVYVPDDIRIGDVNTELMDFLKECNIELRGSYTAQMTLFQ